MKRLPSSLPLPRLAAGPENPQVIAAHDYENAAWFPRRQTGPVKGMGSRDSAAVPQYGRFLRVPRTHELMTRNRRFRFDGGVDGHGPEDRGGGSSNVWASFFEQGADAIRIGQYARRWLRWESSGLCGHALSVIRRRPT